MMRRVFVGLVCSLFICSTAYSYDIKVSSEIPLDGKVSAIAVNPTSGTAAAVCEIDKALYIIDTASENVAKKIPLSNTPSGVSIYKSGNIALIPTLQGTVYFIDLVSGDLLGTADAGTPVYALDVNEQTDEAVLGVDGGLIRVDIDTAKVSTLLVVPGKTAKVCLDIDKAVIVSQDDGNVKLRNVGLDAGDVLQEASLTGEVESIVLDKALGYVLLTQTDKPGLMLYDLNTLQPAGEIETGKRMEIVSVNPSTHIAVLSNTLDGSLSIIDLEAKSLIGNMPMFDGQIGTVCIDPLRNIALVAHDTAVAVVKIENPAPYIDKLIPNECSAGDAGFPLTVEGSKFVGESQTWFNEKMLETKAESTESLKAQVPTEELMEPGEVTVAVTNPTPGGGMSNESKFRILTPAPQLSAIIPGEVAVGQDFELRVEGKNFLRTTYINFNGTRINPRFVSSTVLETVVDAQDIENLGSYPISVTNIGPNTFTSNTLYLEVVTKDDADAQKDNNHSAAFSGTGSLEGRILNTSNKPIAGVQVRSHGLSTFTGQDGYFRLDNIPAGRRTVLIKGSTAYEEGVHYPCVPLTVDIEPGQVNSLPFQPYLQQQNNRHFVDIDPTTDTILTDPEVPGFEMRIPKGVNITGWDGKRNLRVSVQTIPVDKLPVKPLPNGVYAREVYFFYFDKEGGGIPDAPIPVKYPNNIGMRPGEKAILWYYDESPVEGDAPNEWAIAGTCTVSPNGKFIVSDPGFGIPKFCCGASTPSPAVPPNPPTSPDPNSPDGEPVDLYTGYFMYEHTDLHIPGIIPVDIKRVYRSRDSGAAAQNDGGLGAFGKGMELSCDWWLLKDQEIYILFKPGNCQYRFTEEQAGSGIYLNTSNPDMRGAKVVDDGSGTKILTMRDGWTYKFNGDGGLIEIADRNGNKLTIQRKDSFNGAYIITIITAEGREITFEQTLITVGGSPAHFWRTDAIVDPIGRRVSYTYEDNPFSKYPRLKQVESPDGGIIQYGYDSQGRMNTITNERGIVELTNEYDTNNRVVKQTLADGGEYRFSYNAPAGFVLDSTMTAPNGAVKYRVFNSDGYVEQITTADGTTYYDKTSGTNELNSITDTLDRTTTFTHYTTSDARIGMVKTITDTLGNTTAYEYETAYGFPTKITDALNHETNISYNFAGTKLVQKQITDPLNHTTVVKYNVFGMYSSVTDANGNTATFTYDPDNHAELTGATDALGNTVSFTYDELGRVESVTDPNGATTAYEYNPADRVSRVSDAIGAMTRYYYDTRGKLGRVADAKGGVISYEYDDRDRITKMTDQLGRYETYAYYRDTEITPSTGANLKSFTDRKGQVTTFDEYDAMNRLKQITYDDASYTSYTYDAGGRVTAINDSISGQISYTYNDYGCGTCSGAGVNRISQEMTPQGTVDYTYDELSRRVTMLLAGTPEVDYTYDDTGRLTKVSRSIGGTVRDFDIGYDDAGRRTSLQTLLSAPDNFLTTTYSYDIANRLTSMLITNPTSTIDSLSYTYDPHGNRTNMTKTANVPLGAPVSGTDYDAANEMTQLEGYDIAYDENGNLTSKVDASGTTTYNWDARNRLVGISGPSMTASFAYDAFGRRISKTINGTTTDFVYDGWDIIQDTTGSVTTDYTRTLFIDEPLAYERSDDTVRYYVQDALGSVVALTDANGAVTTSYAYDAFGNVTITGSDYNPFQYTGRENDGTGLYCYRFRYYSPEMRRFISEDPIRLRGGINYYKYVKNSPLKLVDPFGLLSDLDRAFGVTDGMYRQIQYPSTFDPFYKPPFLPPPGWDNPGPQPPFNNYNDTPVPPDDTGPDWNWYEDWDWPQPGASPMLPSGTIPPNYEPFFTPVQVWYDNVNSDWWDDFWNLDYYSPPSPNRDFTRGW